MLSGGRGVKWVLGKGLYWLRKGDVYEWGSSEVGQSLGASQLGLGEGWDRGRQGGWVGVAHESEGCQVGGFG